MIRKRKKRKKGRKSRESRRRLRLRGKGRDSWEGQEVDGEQENIKEGRNKRKQRK